ncbi:radical SAM/SPASM domain-containing protein [Geomonas anaerohicana]|uniref:SPASM domain-containing protein n=1 Tax=Geomonas anaerohicana TaxID=2798583 RepID=A0ABS0YC27_9BACT|nr:radical SAM protein [Geomonas anaerohicana]MBJ6749846.1 SPASM domain-containing protein [Geomonas anaerohicana]
MDAFSQSIAGLIKGLAWDHLRKKELKRFVEPDKPRWLPARVQIEVTNMCNLSCPSCSNSRDSGKGKHLDREELFVVLDRIPKVPRVLMSGIGEPLMHPDFFGLVDMLARRDMTCEFITNGTLLTAANREAILARESIRSLLVSCDSTRPERFQALRRGANHERWQESIVALNAQRTSRRPRTLQARMISVISRENIDELEDLVRCAARLGFDGLDLMNLIPIDAEAAAMRLSPEQEAGIDDDGLKEMGRKLGVHVCRYCVARPTHPPAGMLRCLDPWEYIFIRSNGDVYPCHVLFDSQRTVALGNILQQELAEIWDGDAFRDFRLASARGDNALCRDCNFY